MPRSTFRLATTINKLNEIRVPMTKMYLTVPEIICIAVGFGPAVYGWIILLGTGTSFIGVIIYFFLACKLFNTIRKGQPRSYLWDLKYRFGLVKDQRGWMNCHPTRPRLRLSGSHVLGAHKYLGSKKAGDSLAIDHPLRRMMPPGEIHWPMLMPKRKRWTTVSHLDQDPDEDLAPDKRPRRLEYTATIIDTDDLIEPRRASAAQQAQAKALQTSLTAPVWWYAPEGFGPDANQLGHKRVMRGFRAFARVARDQD